MEKVVGQGTNTKKSICHDEIGRCAQNEDTCLGSLHTTAEGREALGFHQSDCKKPRIWPLDPSH